MEQITLKIAGGTLSEIEDEAEERGMSRSEFIRDSVALSY